MTEQAIARVIEAHGLETIEFWDEWGLERNPTHKELRIWLGY